MVEGMCAHQIVISGEYIAYSCSKMFEDGSSRKVRILSVSARSQGIARRPTLIAEQSTPTDQNVMVSPKDALRLMRHSAVESDVVYTVGSTVVTIKLLAQDSSIRWRTWIDALNTCQPTT